MLLSSSVLSFKSSAASTDAPSGGAQPHPPHEDASSPAWTSSSRGPQQPSLPSPHPDAGPTSDDASGPAGGGRSGSSGPGGEVAGEAVPAADVARVVGDMLAAAGLPLGVNEAALLEKALALQEQVAAAETALVLEQQRADSAVKEAETAKVTWQCRVCLTNDVGALLSPCGHVLCESCSTAVNRCPFCRRTVTKVQKMFRP